VDEDEERKRSGQERAAPAELAEKRDEEDGVGVPDPVGETEGDERSGEDEPGAALGPSRVDQITPLA
jgi:hypothetical protein